MESHNAGSYNIGLTKVRYYLEGIIDLEGIIAEGREASLDAVESTQEQVAENGLANQTADINLMEMREDLGQHMRRILQETAANFLYREVPQIDAEDHTSIPDVESSIQQIDTREKNDDIRVLLDHSRSFQDNDLENVDPLESTSHEELNEELGMGVEPNDWQASSFQPDEWNNNIEEDINETQLESITTNWSSEFLSTTHRGDIHLQNALRASHENVIFVEDVPNWLEGSPNR